jgi:two-component system phosphate regulon sensor histidine kinase PhoR
MSSVQLKKLHQMVEKLLETATLDSEKLILKKESVDVVDLVTRISKKHELLTDKNISYSSNVNEKLLGIDLFHIENAISNLVDNAIKYGGENIVINVNSVLNTTEISVADDGKGIDKNQQERIFDKFYRVPKGNRHDVKGFGIGLYYSKKIVEKHGGSISLQINSGNTVFKMNLPNE